jgi:hypothetical protein
LQACAYRGRNSGMDAAYRWLKGADCMFRAAGQSAHETD